MSEYSWSFTHADTFDTCPVQYEAKYVTKEIEFKETDATRWGNHVHLAAEQYLRDGTPVPKDVPYQRHFDWVKQRAEKLGAQLLVENEFGLTREWEPCGYFDRKVTVWCRAKLDVLLIRPDGIAEVIDWKTGTQKVQRTQLMLYALFVMAHFPQIKEVRAGYMWLKDNQLTAPIAYPRFNDATYKKSWEDKYRQIKSARDLGVFVPTPNGLCRKWCEVTRCEFHGRGRR